MPSVFELLREKSFEFILMIRKDFSHPIGDFSMNLLTNIADKYGISLSFWIAHVILSPANSQMLLATSCLGVSFNIAIKMLIRDARPYFNTDLYTPVSWDFEYGSPSGHSQSVTSFFLTLVTLLIKEYNLQKYKKLLYTSTVLYCWFISFTRIFVGLHTLEQILTGLGFGIIIHLLMAHIFFDYFISLFNGIETGKTRFWNPLTLIYFLLNAWAVGMYVMIDNFYPAPQSWLDTISKSWVHSKKFITLHYACLNKQFITWGSIGGYCGLFVKRWWLGDKDGPDRIPIKNASHFILKLSINLGISGLWAMAGTMWPRDAFVVYSLLIRGLLPMFMAGFLVLTFHNRIYRALTWSKDATYSK